MEVPRVNEKNIFGHGVKRGIKRLSTKLKRVFQGIWQAELCRISWLAMVYGCSKCNILANPHTHTRVLACVCLCAKTRVSLDYMSSKPDPYMDMRLVGQGLTSFLPCFSRAELDYDPGFLLAPLPCWPLQKWCLWQNTLAPKSECFLRTEAPIGLYALFDGQWGT